RARVEVVPGWVTEREVFSATPLRSIEARGNGGRRPVGVGPVRLPLCRNKAVRVGWADVGRAVAWASYQSIGTQSKQYLSSDPGWWDRTKKYSSGDRSGENLVVKRARVRVVPGWVTEREVLSATPLGSIEARGNGGRHVMGVGPVGLPLCRNKAMRVGWADVGGAEAW
ncbi:hypothetical protein ACLOJK_004405, partial [Asimina triloba]